MNITDKRYYIRKAEGGWNPCILGNNSSGQRNKTYNVLPNCVGWAVGRFNELGNVGSCKYLGNSNANWFMNWAKQQGLQTGSTPKRGACMVWDNGSCGHVAIVEGVNSATQVYVSESGWDSKSSYWNATLSKGNGNWTSGENWLKNGGYKFLGFIYNPNIRDVIPVTRNTKVDQVQILCKDLRVRKSPSLKGDVISFAPVGYYNVKEQKEADGYLWFKIEDNQWIATKEGNWTIYLEGNPYDYEKIEPVEKVTTRVASVWDLSFKTWEQATVVRQMELGEKIKVVAKYKHSLGGLYYIIEDDYNNKKHYGINSVDVTDYIDDTPEPEEDPIIIEEPIIIIEEDKPEQIEENKSEQVEEYYEKKEKNNVLLHILQGIVDILKKIFRKR